MLVLKRNATKWKNLKHLSTYRYRGTSGTLYETLIQFTNAGIHIIGVHCLLLKNKLGMIEIAIQWFIGKIKYFKSLFAVAL